MPESSEQILPDHVYDPVAAAASHAALSGVLAGFALLVLTNILRPSVGSGEKIPRRPRLEGILVVSVLALVVSAIEWGGIAGMPRRAEVWQQWADFFIGASTPGEYQPTPDEGALLEVSDAARQSVYDVDVAVAMMASGAVVALAAGALAFLASMGDFVAWEVPSDRRATDSFVRAIRYGFTFLVAFAVFEVAVFIFQSWALLVEPKGLKPLWPMDLYATVLALVAGGLSFFAHPHRATGSWAGGWARRMSGAERPGAPNMDLRMGVGSVAVGAIAFALPPAWPGQGVEPWRLWTAGFVLIPAGALFFYYVVALSWRIGVDPPENPGAANNEVPGADRPASGGPVPATDGSELQRPAGAATYGSAGDAPPPS